MRLSKLHATGLLLLAVGLAYWNSLSNALVWDDQMLIVENPVIRNFHYVPALFTHDLYAGRESSAAYYRPLQLLTYTMDYQLWGLDPAGYHLTSVLWHGLCTILVFLLVDRLTQRRTMALVIGCVFAVHPVNINAVTYVAGRADPLALAGLLASFLAFLTWHELPLAARWRRGGWLAASLGAFVFALFSRENAALLPGLILLYLLTAGAEPHRRWRHAFQESLPHCLVLAAFWAWRQQVLVAMEKPVLSTWHISFAERAALVVRALATYLGLLICPVHLQMERQLSSGGFSLWLLTAGGLLGAGLLLAAIIWSTRRDPLLTFGLGWFALTVLPLTGLLNLIASVAEHWLYLPSIGFYLAAALGLSRLRWRPAIVAPACTALLLLFTARTLCRNRDWSSAERLFATTTAAAPDSTRARNNLAVAKMKPETIDEALAELLESEKLAPQDFEIEGNLAAIYLYQGDRKHAIEKLRECLALRPRDTSIILQIAGLYDEQHNYRRAHDHYMAALASSDAMKPRRQFVDFLLHHQHRPEALRVAAEACQLDSASATAWNLRGVALAELGRLPEAERAFQTADRLDLHDLTAQRNLARLQHQLGTAANRQSP